MIDTQFANPVPAPQPKPDPKDPLWQKAVELEAVLFAQMLEVAGVGGLPVAGGATGQAGSQFDSFLRREQAEAVAHSGATGLAQALYRELAARAGA
ncbi:rod-binding protein [Jannaschia aquimarina]|uniref:Rod binding protein n=1 Tax=Jannaschia aquimarina TaxID=935700 RepID=A0A0D1EFN1_9RHOB|nr:rod-binding protein [Jannaschia aquimarina]KIT15691.1 Rod binding protein [Jannaschia aquimarina]SNT39093.1 Rod binding protein [Jannaschia aquimarina]